VDWEDYTDEDQADGNDADLRVSQLPDILANNLSGWASQRTSGKAFRAIRDAWSNMRLRLVDGHWRVLNAAGRRLGEARTVGGDAMSSWITRLVHSSSMMSILDADPRTAGSTWSAGGCGILASALTEIIPNSVLL